MRNKKLIPFKDIEKAIAGEPEAIDTVLRHYTGRIRYLASDTLASDANVRHRPLLLKEIEKICNGSHKL